MTRRARVRSAVLDVLESRRLFAVGDLDPSFGGGAGYVVTNLPAGTPVSSVMAYQADGKLLIASYQIVNAGVPTEWFTLTRLNENGSLDSTFGVDGVSEFGSPLIGSVNAIRGTDIEIDTDGSILASYYWSTSSSSPTSSSATIATSLVRYQADGASSELVTTRRQTITSSGLGPTVIGDTFDQFALAPDGRIYLSGMLANPALPSGATGSIQAGLARINADGSADATFDGDGLLFPSQIGAAALSIPGLTVDPTGDVHFSFETTASTVKSSYGGIARYSSAGALEASSTGVLYNAVGTGGSGRSEFGPLIVTADGATVLGERDVPFFLSNGSSVASLPPERYAGRNPIYGFNGLIDAMIPTGTSSFIGAYSGRQNINSPTNITPALDDVILNRIDPTTTAAPNVAWTHTYDFGGRDEIFAMRDLGNGKLAIAGFTTDVNGVGKVVVGRVLLTNPPIPTAIIAGIVFNDANGNGYRDGSEAGISGRTVYIDVNNNGTLDASEQIARTDAGGYYEFRSLATGTYVVRQVLPSGFTQTTPAGNAAQSVIISAAGQYKFISDFGSRTNVATTSSISGTVWRDNNYNTVRDASEPGVSGRVVYIDANNNGALDAGEKSSTTNASGAYSFANLAAGTYRLRLAAAAGFYQSFPHNNAALWVALGSSNVSGRNFGTMAIPGVTLTGASVGFVRVAGAAVKNVDVFADLNGNNLVDVNEPTDTTTSTGRFVFDTSVQKSQVKLVATATPTTAKKARVSISTDGSAVVYLDRNRSKSLDSGDKELKQTSLFYDINNDGALNEGEFVFKTSRTGKFRFADLPIGVNVGSLRVV